MRAVVISGPGVLAVVERPNPAPAAGELLLAPEAVGLCQTDAELADGTMVYLRQGRARLPLTPGHEWVARVVGLGDGVEGFTIGDRVVGECSIGCGHCPACLSGRYHQCPDRRETGIMNLDGAMSGLMAFPATSAHRVGAGIAVEDAVFAEPAAVALRAVLRADRQPGESLLVVGGGTIGWLIAAIAMDLHGIEAAIAEPEPGRLARAAALGARPIAPDEQFDVVIEASGHPAGLQRGLASLAPSGRLVAVGLTGTHSHAVDMDRLVVSDQTISGSLGSPGVWAQMLETLGTGRVRPSVLVTRRYALRDAEMAYAALRARAPGTGKLLILPEAADRL